MNCARLGLLVLPLALVACHSTPDWNSELPEGAVALLPLRAGADLPDFAPQWEARDEILPALDLSLDWMRRPHAPSTFPIADITHERALRSLERFREVLLNSFGPEDFQRTLAEEFQVYVSAGWDGRGGGVLFTAYCTPLLRGSLTPDATYQEPLYGLPPDLVKGPKGEILGWDTAVGRMPTYPSRGSIEAGALLEGRGLELIWLADPIDAYIAHVNGSAFVELPDGSLVRFGYAGKNGRRYVSLGRELEADGILPRGQASLQRIRDWAARASDEELHEYLSRNESFVFFTQIDGNPHGSLDVEVTGGRSVATDKTLFPRGALVFVEAEVADDYGTPEPFRRFMLDQDTGGAIRTAGRADLYLGVGPEAEARAGKTKSEGQMYYLFLRE